MIPTFFIRYSQLSLAFVVGTLLFSNPATRAQDNDPPAPDPNVPHASSLQVTTRLVTLSAVVQNKKGKPADGLTKADFTLKEDGVDRPIRYFSGGDDLPLTLALMVDISGSQRDLIPDEVAASRIFFHAMLTRPADRAMLVRFGHDVWPLQPMTSAVHTLEQALDHLTDPYPAGVSHNRGGTLFYDAVVGTSFVLAKQDHGRRAIVILTDGEDHGSRANVDQAIVEAQDANAVVYSVFYSARGAGKKATLLQSATEGASILKTIAQETGGRSFTVTASVPLTKIFEQISIDLRSQYEIGYTPVDPTPGKYHRIELKPTQKALVVVARKGYRSK